MKKLTSILLVDDDPTSCFLTQYIIEEMQLTDQIYILPGGREALDFIRSRQALPDFCLDLILLDINMPDMDGFEFLDAFEDLTGNSKSSVVMLTTSSNVRDLDKAKVYRVVDYLNKPITEEKLQEIISKHF
jgi:CheY-like chemotaxis protein